MNLKSIIKNIFFYEITVGKTPFYRILISTFAKAIIFAILFHLSIEYAYSLFGSLGETIVATIAFSLPIIMLVFTQVFILSGKDYYFRFNIKNSLPKPYLMIAILIVKVAIIYALYAAFYNNGYYAWVYRWLYDDYNWSSIFGVYAFSEKYVWFYTFIMWFTILSGIVLLAYIGNLLKCKKLAKVGVVVSLYLLFVAFQYIGSTKYDHIHMDVGGLLLLISVVIFVFSAVHLKLTKSLKYFAVPTVVWMLFFIPAMTKMGDFYTCIKPISQKLDEVRDKKESLSVLYNLHTSRYFLGYSDWHEEHQKACQAVVRTKHPLVLLSYGISLFNQVHQKVDYYEPEDRTLTEKQKQQVIQAINYIASEFNTYQRENERNPNISYNELSYHAEKIVEDRNENIFLAYDLSGLILADIFAYGLYVEPLGEHFGKYNELLKFSFSRGGQISQRREWFDGRAPSCYRDTKYKNSSCQTEYQKRVKENVAQLREDPKNNAVIFSLLFNGLKMAEFGDFEEDFPNLKQLPSLVSSIQRQYNLSRDFDPNDRASIYAEGFKNGESLSGLLGEISSLSSLKTEAKQKAQVLYLLGKLYDYHYGLPVAWHSIGKLDITNDTLIARSYYQEAAELGSEKAKLALLQLDEDKEKYKVDYFSLTEKDYEYVKENRR